MKVQNVKMLVRKVVLATLVVGSGVALAANPVVYDLNGGTVTNSFNNGSAINDYDVYVHGPGTFVATSRLYKNATANTIQFDGGAVVLMTTGNGANNGLMVAGGLDRVIDLGNCTIVSCFDATTTLSRDVSLRLCDTEVGTTFSPISASGKVITMTTYQGTFLYGSTITGPGRLNLVGEWVNGALGTFEFSAGGNGKPFTYDYSGETTVSNASVSVKKQIPNSHFTLEGGGMLNLNGGNNYVPQGIVIKAGARLNLNASATADKLDVREGAEFAFEVKSGTPFVLTATNSTWPTTPHSVFVRLTTVPADGETLVIVGVGETPANVFYPQYDQMGNTRVTFTVHDGNLYAVGTSSTSTVVNLNGETLTGCFSPDLTKGTAIDRAWEVHGPGVFDSDSRLYPNNTVHTVTIDGGAEVWLTTHNAATDGLIVSGNLDCTVDLGDCTIKSKFDIDTCLARYVTLNLTDATKGTTVSTTSVSGTPITIGTGAWQTSIITGVGALNVAGEGTFQFDQEGQFDYSGATTVKSNATAVLNKSVLHSAFIVEQGGRLVIGLNNPEIGGLTLVDGSIIGFGLDSSRTSYALATPVTMPASGTVLIEPTVVSEPATGTYPLLTGLGAATVDRFALTSSQAGTKHLALQLTNGTLNLVVTLAEASSVTWTGAGADRLWSTAANWLNDQPPSGNVNALFGADAGTGPTMNDLATLTFGSLTFTAAAPEGVHAGAETLGVKTAVTNFAAAAQTLDLPLNLGDADDLAAPFTLAVNEAQGLLTMTGAVNVIADAIVKTGSGTAVVADSVIGRPLAVTVAEGVLKVGRRTGVISARYHRDVIPPNNEVGALLWTQTRLADVTGVRAESVGKSIGNNYPMRTVLWQNDGQNASCQFQFYDGTAYTKCVVVAFWQNGSDVYVRTVQSCYTTGNIVGADMSEGHTPMDVATSASANGYNVRGIVPTLASGVEPTFEVRSGAQFDFALEPRSATVADTLATFGRTFSIAGAGPDGHGALVETGTDGLNGEWYMPGIYHLILTGDAKVSGGNITVREHSDLGGGAHDGLPRIEGPFTLTADCSNRGFECTCVTFALDKLVNEDRLFIAHEVYGTITNSVHLVDGSRLHLYAADTAAGIPFVAEANGGNAATMMVTSANGVSTVRGSLTVEPSVTVNFATLDSNVKFLGSVTNNGHMAYVSGAGMALFGGTLAGSGSLAGGQIAFSTLDGDTPCWQLAADENGFTEKIDITQVVADNPAFLVGLKRMEVAYAGTAGNKVFDIGPAGDLTPAAAASIDLVVRNAGGTALSDCFLEIAEGRFMLHILDDRFPAIATWTGAKDGNIADPDNWVCVNTRGGAAEGTIPSVYTSVRLGSNTAFNCPAGTPFACRELVIGNTTLEADCDWSGIDFSLLVPNGNATIDLKGHNLTLSITENLTRHLIVTDSSLYGEGGELHVTVPEGKTPFSNGNSKIWLELTGSLKFVKDGPGTFIVLGDNTYTGGTRVAGGELWTYNDTASSTYAFRDETGKKWKHLGRFDTTVQVDEGAKLDIRGLYFFAHYKLVLNGGTFASSGYTQNQANTTADAAYQGLGDLTLLADSFIEIKQRTHFKSYGYTSSGTTYANLGGHTLTINHADGTGSANDRLVFLFNYGFTNGTVVVNGGTTATSGQLVSRGARNDFRGSTLVLNCRLNLEQSMDVGNLTTRYTGTFADNSGTLYVYGTFRPESDYLHNFQLQNGSGIDLSETNDTWCANSSLTGKTLAFERNARVVIDIGTRQLRSGDRVIEWAADAVPPNVETVKFKPKQRNCELVRKDNAVVYLRGLIVFIR